MTRRTSEMMAALAEPEAYPQLLLAGRIAFRTSWAMRNPKRPPVRDKDRKWMVEYDEDHNFAHMGARYIDDENWGMPKKVKKKPAKLSPEVTRLLALMRASKFATAQAQGAI